MLGQKTDQVSLEPIVQDAEKSGGGTIYASPFQAHGGAIENRWRNYIHVLHARHDDRTSKVRLGFYRHTWLGGKLLKGHIEYADKYTIDR